MPVELPTSPDRTPLIRSPLSLVVCQIRYETNLAVGEPQTARTFHDAIGGRHGAYSKVVPISGVAVNLALAPSSEPSVSQRQALGGWRFAAEDDSVVVSLMPDHVAIETSAYTTWEDDFRRRLHDVLHATAEFVNPVFEQRLGLRYINQLAEPDVQEPQHWERWIAPELLGALLHPMLGSGVLFSRQQLSLDLGESRFCTLNHGFAPDPAREGMLTYLLDYDVYREGQRPFDVSDIETTADKFNTDSLALFQTSVTSALLDHCAQP